MDELTLEERVTKLEVTLAKVEKAFLNNPGFFPPEVEQLLADLDEEMI